MYFKNGRVKVAIALAKGKNTIDKRETVRRREADRETRAAIKARRGLMPRRARADCSASRGIIAPMKRPMWLVVGVAAVPRRLAGCSRPGGSENVAVDLVEQFDRGHGQAPRPEIVLDRSRRRSAA